MGHQENFGETGFPPIYYTVLDKRTIVDGDNFKVVKYWLAGEHIHMGKIIQGLTGTETEVTLQTSIFEGGVHKRYIK